MAVYAPCFGRFWVRNLTALGLSRAGLAGVSITLGLGSVMGGSSFLMLMISGGSDSCVALGLRLFTALIDSVEGSLDLKFLCFSSRKLFFWSVPWDFDRDLYGGCTVTLDFRLPMEALEVSWCTTGCRTLGGVD